MCIFRALLAGLGCLASATFAPLAAVDFVVTRYDDPFPNGCAPTDCSLREATLDANESAGADRVLLSAGKYDLTRFTGDDEGLLGDLDLHDEVEIVGAGATMRTIDAAPIGTAAEDPVISAFATTVLRDLKLTGSCCEGAAAKVPLPGTSSVRPLAPQSLTRPALLPTRQSAGWRVISAKLSAGLDRPARPREVGNA